MSLMANNQKKKALEFISNAQKALSKKAWFASGRERNAEDAAELMMQAANAYKVGGWHHDAGTAYMKAAKIYQITLSMSNEASKCFSQAGACFKKSNPVDAIQAYKAAVSLMTDAGRLNQAAKLCKECGELYESEEVEPTTTGDDKSSIVLAIEFYEQAAELFGLEEAKSAQSQSLAKIAELCSAALNPPDLSRAAHIYDQLGRNCLESNLLKYNAKIFFLQAIFCHLAQQDAVAAQQAMDRYEGVDYTFGESREGKFCKKITECMEGYDAEGFSQAVYEFDRISKLDPWKTSMLLKVKRGICDEVGEGEDEDDLDLT